MAERMDTMTTATAERPETKRRRRIWGALDFVRDVVTVALGLAIALAIGYGVSLWLHP